MPRLLSCFLLLTCTAVARAGAAEYHVAFTSKDTHPGSSAQAFRTSGNRGGIRLSGLLTAPDAPGEWFVHGGSLYLMTVDRRDPSGHLVKMRTGSLASDLSSRNWIVLKVLTCYTGSAQLTGSNCAIRNCSFNHHTHEWLNNGYGRHGGLDVGGSTNRGDSCLFDGSSGNGVNLAGRKNAVRNCVVRKVNYSVTYSAVVNTT